MNRLAFAEAVAAHLEPRLAERLHEAWRATSPKAEPDETYAAAGAALAVAMTGLPAADSAKQVAALGLYEVALSEVGVELTPAEAYGHPLISAWVASTFADLLGEIVSAGRTAANLGSTAPLYNFVNLFIENGEAIRATATMTFPVRDGALTVEMRFGRPASGQFAQVAMAAADAIFSVGVAMRGLPSELPPPSTNDVAPGVVH